MANIFKTKEAYKNTSPTIKVNPLRRIRGVYVTGPYRPPYCIDHTLTVTSVESQEATIVSYTEASRDINTYAASWLGIQSYGRPVINKFTTSSDNLPTTYAAAWTSVRQSHGLILNKYQTTSTDIPSTYAASWLSIQQSHALTIKKYRKANMPEFVNHAVLQIMSVDSNTADIQVSE